MGGNVGEFPTLKKSELAVPSQVPETGVSKPGMATKRDDRSGRKKMGKGIRQWRQSHKLSQLACANRLNISHRYIRMLEKDERQPSLDLAIRMAETTERGCMCALGFQFCPQRNAQTGEGVSAPA